MRRYAYSLTNSTRRIFENGADEDCLRLLVGRLPSTQNFGPASPSSGEEKYKYSSLPLSAHYARVLAQLASERGFDGYLLNFECPLQGGVEQCRALAAWISLVRVELQKRVGFHAEVIWYCPMLCTPFRTLIHQQVRLCDIQWTTPVARSVERRQHAILLTFNWILHQLHRTFS